MKPIQNQKLNPIKIEIQTGIIVKIEIKIL